MQQRRRAWLGIVWMLAASELSGPATAEPILHEYFEANPAEDITFGATTGDGAMAAAITTRSGIVEAPTGAEAPPGSQETYGSDSANAESDSSYRIDRDTTRPEVVSYSDPFTPSIPPFKRLHAYDAVGSGFELVVSEPSLSKLELGGSARDTDDQFYADLQVDSLPGVPIRIPSVGPATRVLVARTEPETPFVLLRDRADNWFIQSDHSGRFRLILQLAIDRRTFGSAFANSSWATLQRFLPPIPEDVAGIAREVAQTIGVSREDSPSTALQTLITYFRDFSASEDSLTHTGRDLYVEICSSKKGVCRHRAYGFAITALGLGLPTRFVHNEAHAWVEVFDGSLWHRIDLGGAAGRVELGHDERPTHVVPPDPHRWPPGGTSAEAMTERALRGRGNRASDPSGAQPGMSTSNQTGSNGGASSTAPRADEKEYDDAPPSTIEVGSIEKETRRGGRIHVSGSVVAEGNGCDQVRVDIALRRATSKDDVAAERVGLGSLVTDRAGAFSGNLVVPLKLPVGDYEVVATTPGRSLICGSGHSP